MDLIKKVKENAAGDRKKRKKLKKLYKEMSVSEKRLYGKKKAEK